MSKKLLIPLVIVGVGFVAACVYAVVLNGQLSTARNELATTRSQLATTSSELDSAKQEMAAVKASLETTKTDLQSARTEIAGVKSELATSADRLASAQSQTSSLQMQLSGAQRELSTAKDTLKGLGVTIASSSACTDATLTDNSTAANPTYAQVISFLVKDATEQHTYSAGVYDCSEFSRDVHNKAEAAGIRAAVVHAYFVGETAGHALNAFLTSDYGLVYVDCTGIPDKIARVKLGAGFRAVAATEMLPSNLRNDAYWNGLMSYYYVPSASSVRSASVTASITIFW